VEAFKSFDSLVLLTKCVWSLGFQVLIQSMNSPGLYAGARSDLSTM